MGRPEIASSLAPWAAAWPARGGAGPAEGVLPSGEAGELMEGVLPGGELAEGVLPSGGAGVLVPGVMLLGVRVAAWVIIDLGEHRRRGAAGVGAVVSPGLLDRLMDLPAGVPVMDPVVWVEMAGQPAGVVERGEDGVSVTRRLEAPLAITDVVVEAGAGRELSGVREASLFGGVARRWVAVARGRVPDAAALDAAVPEAAVLEAAVLEAKLCGVGVLDPRGGVLVAAEKPVRPVVDGWSWLLAEKVYRRWLAQVQPLAKPAGYGLADTAL